MSKNVLSLSIFLILGAMILAPIYPNLGQGQSGNSTSSGIRNVTALSNLAGNNSQVELENRTVNYFPDATGYLVYPLSKRKSMPTFLPWQISRIG